MRRFFVPDKEKCEAFLRAQKNVLEQNRTKGEARLRFCGSRAPKGRSAYNPVMCSFGYFYLFFKIAISLLIVIHKIFHILYFSSIIFLDLCFYYYFLFHSYFYISPIFPTVFCSIQKSFFN